MNNRQNDENQLIQQINHEQFNEDNEETMNDNVFYNTPQAAELLGVPHTTLRGWFIELEETYGVHSLPRNSRGRRIFRKEDIEIAKAIKQMRERNLPFEVIVEMLKKRFPDTLFFNPNYAPRVNERDRNYYEQLTRLFRDEFFNYMEELHFESERKITNEIINIQNLIQSNLSHDREALKVLLEKWKIDIEEKIREEYENEQQKLLQKIQDIMEERANEYKEREQRLMKRINQLIEEKEQKKGFFSRLFGKNEK